MRTTIIALVLIFSLFSVISFISAQEVTSCCERLTSGAWCQNAPAGQCDSKYRSSPSSCEATSFCKIGFCYDSREGTCAENTPQKVCEKEGGVWQEDTGETPAQCQLGCCLIGDQAAYVTQVRCKRLSAVYGLETNFRADIRNEVQCIASSLTEEKGACVREVNFEKTCKITTRQECQGAGTQLTQNFTGNASAGEVRVEFHPDFLCSAEELATNCGPSERTTCVDGKDEVYFLDTCENVANIYDASKIKDKTYWRKIVGKDASCNPASNNANSRSCGNCNYFGGSICKQYDRAKDKAKPNYGNNLCRDLSCSQDGEKFQHGETWCAEDEKDRVGSKYYRYVCFNSEVTVEPCADFRQAICIQSTSNTGFRNAACRANRWQDCFSQTNQRACENTDKRDCKWIEGVAPLGGAARQQGLIPEAGFGGEEEQEEGVCVPVHSPGLDFWNVGGQAQQICSLGNAQCIVKYEEKVFGDKKCVKNCECLEDSWAKKMNVVCTALGDCGDKTNFLGIKGYTKGYTLTIGKKIDKNDDPTQPVEQPAQQPQRFTSTQPQTPPVTSPPPTATGGATPGQTIGGSTG